MVWIKCILSYFLLATCYYYLKQCSKSIDCVKESLKLNNKHASTKILLSVNYFHEGHYEKALNQLQNIDRINLRIRDIVDVELQLANIFMVLGYEETSACHFKMLNK